MAEEEKIELRSEPVQEIMSAIPKRLTRWGITIIFLFLAALIALSFFVSYPEVVKGHASLISSKPPIPVVARADGNIETIEVTDGQKVQDDDILLTIDGHADKEVIEEVEHEVHEFLETPQAELLKTEFHFPEGEELGHLETHYTYFLENWREYQFIQKRSTFNENVSFIQQQISQLRSRNIVLEGQLNDCYTELQNMQQNINMDYQLYQKGVISLREFQTIESAFIAKKSACDQIQQTIASNDVLIKDYSVQITNKDLSEDQTRLLKHSGLVESAKWLLNEIHKWEDNYVVRAPVSGVVSIDNVWDKNQYITANAPVLTIVQEDTDFRVRAMLEQQDIGKVVPGQEVNLKFQGYDFHEFGIIKGIVSSISLIPNEGKYTAEIELPNGLKTTFKEKEVSFKEGLTGVAEIITEKKSFAARLFEKFKYLVVKD